MPFQRPNLPYANVSLLNSNRYEALTNSATPRPVPYQALDGDTNYLIDTANNLQIQIDGLVVGILPGSDSPDNANLFPTTDGNSNISWILVGQDQLANGAVTQLALANNSVGTPQLQNVCVTAAQIAVLSVTQDKLGLGSVGTNQLQNASVTGAKIANNTITAAQIAGTTITGDRLANNTITAAQIANNTITGVQIANSSISGATKITYGTVIGNNMSPLAIGTSRINGAFVTFDGTQPVGNIVPTNTTANIVSVTKIAVGQYNVTFLNPTNSPVFPLTVSAVVGDALIFSTINVVSQTTISIYLFIQIGLDVVPLDNSAVSAGIIFYS
jgi:hypothetical protein